VQGVRPEVEEHKPQHNPVYGLSHTATAAATAPAPATSQPVTLHTAVDNTEREQVERLFNTLVAAKKKAGENVSGNLDSFSTFVQKKTAEIRSKFGCQDVEFSVELADGHVKLKAKAKA
jgi:3-oxoacyl-ACP reductase-like protein